MKPDPSVIEVGVPQNDRAFALVEHGKAYAICLVGSGPAELTLNMPAGKFDAEWIETADGSVVKKDPFTHPGGMRRLQSPKFAQDISLRINVEKGQ